MNKINLNLQQFLSICMEDCLNYNPHQELENIVKQYANALVKSLRSSNYRNLSTEDKLDYFLKQILLKIATHNVWIKLSIENNLNQNYLYTVIKKYLFLYAPELT